MLAAILCAAIGGALLAFGDAAAPEVQPPVKPVKLDVVIRQNDTPASATLKANVRYLQEQVAEFRELAEKAGTFADSGSAADWMESQSAKGHAEAFRPWHGYLFGFFGEGKKYDPEDVKRWATGMADGAQAAIDALRPLVQE